MTCDHLNGGLQIPVCESGGWQVCCLMCGERTPMEGTALPEAAGEAAALGFLRRSQRRFPEAAGCFQRAADLSGDPRCRYAALMCQLGVVWCGDEHQPTFYAADMPFSPLADDPGWQALENDRSRLSPYAFQAMADQLTRLEEILHCLRSRMGRSAADVFLCYRRTRANVIRALELYRDLKKQGLRVFCADVTTRGKTQEQFEAEVYHALRTAEYLVLLPGDGEDALSPWLLNELERAACPKENRFICTDGHPKLPDVSGEALSLNEIRMVLSRAAADCTPERLWSRAVSALEKGDGAAARPLLLRACAADHQPARLMLATLHEEGFLLPQSAAAAAHFRALAANPADDCRQQVYAALEGVELALGMPRRRAVLYIAADVSDAGLSVSRALLRPLLSSLRAERRLAGADVCLVGYDRHALILEEPKALAKYGLPESAAALLHTSREQGRDQSAYAAKGLRCAADHLLRHPAEGQLPLIVLLRSGAASDAPHAVPAALAAISNHFRNAESAVVASPTQIPGCINGLLEALSR